MIHRTGRKSVHTVSSYRAEGGKEEKGNEGLWAIRVEESGRCVGRPTVGLLLLH